MTPREGAAVAMIGGADGPMVLFTSLILAKDLFVPITVVGYLYLGLTYGGYPYLIKLLIPRRLRAIPMPSEDIVNITSGQKLAFAVIACTLLCLLFPVAAPLFLALFIGVAVRESGLVKFQALLSDTVLYGATFFLGLTLGILCEASTILSPVVVKLLLLGILALTLAGVGRHPRRLRDVLLVPGKVQPDDRHRGRQLRADDRQDRAKAGDRGQPRRGDPAARPGRQHQRRHHHGNPHRNLRRAAALRPRLIACSASQPIPLCRHGSGADALDQDVGSGRRVLP